MTKTALELKVNEKMREYDERFGDMFPLMMFGGTFEDAIAEIDRCLALNKPFDPYFGGEIPKDVWF